MGRWQQAFVTYPPRKRQHKITACTVADEHNLAAQMRDLLGHACVHLVVLPLVPCALAIIAAVIGAEVVRDGVGGVFFVGGVAIVRTRDDVGETPLVTLNYVSIDCCGVLHGGREGRMLEQAVFHSVYFGKRFVLSGKLGGS